MLSKELMLVLSERQVQSLIDIEELITALGLTRNPELETRNSAEAL